MPKKILVVDDDATVRSLLSKYLQSQNYKTTACPDGFSALDHLHSGEFDLAIIDISMPMMSGLDLLTKVRGNPKLRELPVIMLTSSDRRQDIERCFKLKVTDYIIKPPGKQEVMLRIKRAIEGIKPEGILVSRNEEELTGVSQFKIDLVKIKKDGFLLAGHMNLPSNFIFLNLELPIFKEIGIKQMNFSIIKSVEVREGIYHYPILLSDEADRQKVQNWLEQQIEKNPKNKAS